MGGWNIEMTKSGTIKCEARCAVVSEEPCWLWFIQKLKGDLDLRDGDGFTLISDRQKVRQI